MTVTIVIPTHQPSGIERVAANVMPHKDDVDYVISWQNHCGYPLPEQLQRSDIKVLRYDGTGLSNNRNNALEHAAGDILLLADDDVAIIPGAIERLRDVYIRHPEADFVTYRSISPGIRVYPEVETVIGLPYPKGYVPSGIEYSLRRKTAGFLRFCPELGPGAARFTCAEDTVFMLAAVRHGLICLFVPITVCEHPQESTGTRNDIPAGNLRAMGVNIALQYPYSAILRIPLKAWRVFRKQSTPLLPAFLHLAVGALSARSLLKRNHKTLW